MKAQTKAVKTPVGLFPFPMNPGFTKQLGNCVTNEDLFKLVEENGFINPDAFTELNSRNLYYEYKNWKQSKTT
ncbi:MAG: hypothetical protein V3V72_13440 [Ignavibacteriaceae bacterium]